jgi:hypothetical protein
VDEPVLNDLAEFVRDHRPHGPLTAETTEPGWNGIAHGCRDPEVLGLKQVSLPGVSQV